MKNKIVFEIETPVGKFYIAYRAEGFYFYTTKDKNYSCWVSGCCIGGHTNNLTEARLHIKKYIKDRLHREFVKLKEEFDKIKNFQVEIDKIIPEDYDLEYYTGQIQAYDRGNE